MFIGEHDDGTVTEIESRDVTFLENEFPSRGEIEKNIPFFEKDESEEIDTQNQSVEEDNGPLQLPVLSGSSQPNSSEPSLRRSNRPITKRRRFLIEGEALMVSPLDEDEPKTVSEALSCPAKDKWKKAMEEEMDSMRSNHVWDLVELPPGRKAIGNKWVLKIKRGVDGSIERYKARLVAKGFTQREGVDFEDTFSPVVRFTSIHLILAIVAHLDLELHQMDVKTAFLNGELDEEIYMDQPATFVEAGQEGKVCRLNRSIYGLKQSSRQWYLRFHRTILTFGFSMIDEDHCVYVKKSKDDFAILSLYVDDILIAGKNKEFVAIIKEWLSSTFEMKDMGEANYILGVKILRDRSRKLISLSQETYINKVLERFHMQNCNPIDTPIAKGDGLSLKMCPKTLDEINDMKKVPYASAVGSLMYAMMCTRPDICYAVGLVSRYQSNPGREHWKAVKRIFRYLKGTANYMLCYQGHDLQLRGYTDTDWGGDLDERKSTSGYVFSLNNGVISWSSKKQSCVALSTMEAEFVACSAAVQEAIWLRRFLLHLGVSVLANGPVHLYCDNQAAIAHTKDSRYHSRTKHIDIKYNFIRDIVAQKLVIPEYVSTHRMLADPLTKPITRDVFMGHVKSMGLRRS